MIAYTIVGVLIATNLVTLLFFLRARSLVGNSNTQNIQNWLAVHKALERSSNAVIEIKKLDTDEIFYREPSR